MKCDYCSTPILSAGTNCINCGGPLPVFQGSMIRSRTMIDITTHSDDQPQFLCSGIVDPAYLKELEEFYQPAWKRWPGGAPT